MSWSAHLLPGRVGIQEPRVRVAPMAESWESGEKALWMFERLETAQGDPALELMPWQEQGISEALATREDGLWAASDVGVIVARQNGKGDFLIALVLAHILLFGARRVLWTAQLQKTSDDAHKRMSTMIKNCPELFDRLDKSTRDGGITYGSGTKTIRFATGQEIQFFTRTESAGRGLPADVLICDEAYDLTDSELAALAPTLKTAWNPQIIYTSTPPDEDVHPNGIVLARLRKRSLEDQEKREQGVVCEERRLWLEWSVPEETDHLNRDAWARGNPSLGYLFTEDTILADLGRMGVRKFRVEDLCAPDFWPDPDEVSIEDVPIDRETAWRPAADPTMILVQPIVLGLAVSMDRKTAIVAAGRTEDGRKGIETIAHAYGTEWVVDVLLEVVDRHEPAALILDAGGPAGSLIPALTAAGLEPELVGARQVAQSAQALADDLNPLADRVRHRGNDAPLNGAVDIVRWRPLMDARAFARKGYGDISPIEAASLAATGVDQIVAAGGVSKPPAEPIPVGEAETGGGWPGASYVPSDVMDVQNVGF